MTAHSSSFPLHVLFVFIDGVGLGEQAPQVNPLFQLSLPSIEKLAAGQPWTNQVDSIITEKHIFKAVDARLGVEGLPQSGTGQATLFTGINCAEVAGRHFGPYPHSTSKPLLASESVFSKVQQLFPAHLEPAAFANAYPPIFFKHAEARNRWTVTTYACMEANIRIRQTQEVRDGLALTAELTGQAWNERLQIGIDVIPEEEAGRRLVSLSKHHPFTLFEYFLTDKAGHSRTFEQAESILKSLDRFFTGILAHINLENTLLLVTSDHGNIEDLSTRSHTLNPVPLIALGKGAHHFGSAGSILDITPIIMETLIQLNRTS